MNQKQAFPYLCSIEINGYRPFRNFTATFSELEVIVGSNGSGKSSLFEFLKFLRDGAEHEIPPEIVPGSAGQQLFHRPGPDTLNWRIQVNRLDSQIVSYQGLLLGPVGQPQVLSESGGSSGSFFEMQGRKGQASEDVDEENEAITAIQELNVPKPNRLALSLMTSPMFPRSVYKLREYMTNWRFYSAWDIDRNKIRRSVPVEQEPILRADGSNLSAVLFYLFSEYPSVFDQLKTHLRSAVPGFRNLTVKARGGPGEVIAFWQEEGVEGELSLADVSDGTLYFLCWATLCLTPKPPTLICIDEPDQGVHPRILPILAGLFEKASVRTQLLLATHASYFLTQFDLSRIAVMKKVDGKSYYLKPVDSETLKANLEDFGIAELEAMHRSDELEVLV